MEAFADQCRSIHVVSSLVNNPRLPDPRLSAIVNISSTRGLVTSTYQSDVFSSNIRFISSPTFLNVVSLKGKFSLKRIWVAGVPDFRKISSPLLTTHLAILVFKKPAEVIENTFNCQLSFYFGFELRLHQHAFLKSKLTVEGFSNLTETLQLTNTLLTRAGAQLQPHSGL